MNETTIVFRDIVSRVLILDPEEHIQRHWMNGRFYEANRNGLLTFMAGYYAPGLSYVDVGASIGNHTLFFLSVLKAKEVITVEPYPESDAHLYANVTLNGWEHRVISFPCAASNEKHTVKVSRYDTGRTNVGMVKIGDEGVAVGAMPLDDMLEGFHVDVIKIDVEHYNIPVLEGAAKTLITLGPDVYIECENEKERDETDAFMREFGYRRSNLVFNATPTYQYLRD